VMGSQSPFSLTASGLTKVLGTPTAQADLRAVPDFGPHSTAAWVSIMRGNIWLTGDQVNRYTGSGPLLTDDHPLSEYFLLDSKLSLATGTVQVSLVVSALAILLMLGAVIDTLTQRRARRAA
jgi:hypothetical protein